MTRVYCALTPADLDSLPTSGFVASHAFAVTDAVRALVPDGDEELYEHLATQFAAATASGERVLLAALEVPAARITEGGSEPAGSVVVDGAVTTRDVVCYLVGDAGDVAGDEADLELSWYDAGERDEVRRLV